MSGQENERVRHARSAYLLLMFVMLLWSGNFIVGRAMNHVVPPFTLALVRWSGALCVLTPFAARGVVDDAARLRASWRIILLLGLTGVAAYNALIYSGLRHTGASNALLLQAGTPALVLLLDRLLNDVRPVPLQLAGVTLSTIGVMVVVCKGDPTMLGDLSFGIGDLLVLAGVAAWSLYTVLLKRRPAVRPLSFLAVTFAIGVAAMIPLAATELPAIRQIPLTGPVLAAMGYVALLPSLIAYILYNRAVAQIGAGRASQTIGMMPLFGALLAALLLGEPLAGYHWAAMLLIVGGLSLGAITGQRERPVPERSISPPSR